MSVNPNTGKIWVNNYKLMYGTLFINQNHKYIQLDRYYDLVGKLEGRTKTMYAMLLHAHIAQITCNRIPGTKYNIFMYIDTKNGRISNQREMREWMLKDGWMNCDAKYLLDIASESIWYTTFKTMLGIGLLEQNGGVLRCMVPIDGRFLPIPYAHVAFLSRLKRDSQLNSAISKAISSTPDKIKSKLDELSKDELIEEIVRIKSDGLVGGKNSEVYKMLYEEISHKYPHKWNDGDNKNYGDRENFLESIVEKSVKKLVKNSENEEKLNEYPGENTADQIANNLNVKMQENLDKKEKLKIKNKEKNTLNIEEFHNFEIEKSNRGRKKGGQNKQKEIDQRIENDLFYADDVTAHDAERVIKNNSEDNVEEIPELIDDITDIPDIEFDMFGLQIGEEHEEDIPEIPESIINKLNELKNENDEFWD